MRKYTVPEVLPLAQKVYNSGVGCCLHIVLEDGNLLDSHIQFCAEQAALRDHADCKELCSILLTLSKTQRKKIYSLI